MLGAVLSTAVGTADAQLPCVQPLCTPSTTTTTTTPTTTTPPPPTTTAPAPPPVGPTGSTAGTATPSVDAGRTGVVPGATLVPPLARLWTHRLPGPAADTPVIGDGQVFVVSNTKVYALNEATGRVRWTAKAPDNGTEVGYADGLVVVSGILSGASRAYDAATGAPRWNGNLLGGAPVIADGAVYGPGGAVSAADGKRVLSYYADGDEGDAAVTEDSVYLSGSCGEIYRVDRATGNQVWRVKHGAGDCASGGGGGSAVVGGGRVFATSEFGSPALVDAATGKAVATNLPETSALMYGTTMVGTTAKALLQRRLSDGKVLRKVGLFGSGPIIGAGRWLFRLEGTTLEERSAGSLHGVAAAGVPSDNPVADSSNVGGQSLITAGPGLVVAVSGREVTGFASAFLPKPAALESRATSTEYGSKAIVLGRGGSRLTGQKVHIRAHGRTLAHGRIGSDGFIELRAKVGSNTKLRLATAHAHSRAFGVYVYPKIRYHFRHRSDGRAIATVVFTASRKVGFGGRAAYVYLVEPDAHRVLRLGHGTLAGAGAGRGRADILLKAVSNVSDDAYLLSCVRGMKQLHLGDPRDDLVTRCGHKLPY